MRKPKHYMVTVSSKRIEEYEKKIRSLEYELDNLKSEYYRMKMYYDDEVVENVELLGRVQKAERELKTKALWRIACNRLGAWMEKQIRLI